MDTPAFEKSFKGNLMWILWNIGFVITSALPMICFIACLFVIVIKRDATILISILMMAMLHPIFTLTTGVFAKTMGQFLSRKCSSRVFHTYILMCQKFEILFCIPFKSKITSKYPHDSNFSFLGHHLGVP